MMKKAVDLKPDDKFLMGGVEQQLAYRTETDSYGVVRLVLASGYDVKVSWDCRFTMVEQKGE